MIAIYVCAGIAVYAAIRVILERNTMRKLPFLNVVSFAVTGIIALLLPHPITIAAAAALFCRFHARIQCHREHMVRGDQKDG